MKRILSLLCAAAVISAAVLCGCGSDQGSSGAGGSSQSSAQDGGTVAPTTAQPLTDSTVKTTGGKVHITDNTLGDIWISELEGVALNKLNADGFTSDAAFKYYSEGGKPASEEGIDISSFSGKVDWVQVKESGVDFAMIRLGGRSYGAEGKLYTDDSALDYISGAREAGIKVGAYFFSQATTNAEAEEEAEYAHSILGDIKLDYPLAYDWEIIKDDNARTDGITATQATECAAAFCEKAKALGYVPMVYSASREFYFKYDLTRLKDYQLWLAQYADVPNFYYEFSMWQYSDHGKVEGIEGTVDLNICFTGVAPYAK
ncbi:MAG: glycoside hydrolase family 25 protein [Ruminococcus sp.]